MLGLDYSSKAIIWRINIKIVIEIVVEKETYKEAHL